MFRRIFKIPLILIQIVAVVYLLIILLWPDRTIIATIAIGEGEHELGLGSGGYEVERTCPGNFVVNDAGTALLLDRLNAKVLSLDLTSGQVTDELSLPVRSELSLESLLMLDRDLWAWANGHSGAGNQVVYVASINDAGQLTSRSSGAGFSAGPPRASKDIEAEMEKLGFYQDKSSGSGFSFAAITYAAKWLAQAPTDFEPSEWISQIRNPAGDDVAVKFVKSAAGIIDVTVMAADDQTQSYRYISNGSIIDATVEKLSSAGDLYLRIAEQRGDWIRHELVALAAGSDARKIYNIPSAQSLCPGTDHLSVGDDGTVYFLRVGHDSASFERLRAKPDLVRKGDKFLEPLLHDTPFEDALAEIGRSEVFETLFNSQEDEPRVSASGEGSVVVITLDPEPKAEPAADVEEEEEAEPAAVEPVAEAAPEEVPAVETPAPATIARTMTIAERLGLNATDPFPIITRKQILDHAEAYLTHAWTLSEKNHSPDAGICLYFRANSCWRAKDNCDLWMRPAYLKDKSGQGLTGVPYVWNGFDSLDQFNEKIARGRPAGDVCTPGKARAANSGSRSIPSMFIRDGQRTVNYIYAAGVDCSGFVSRVWQLKGKRGTATFTGGAGLDPVAKEIKWKNIKPGDILDLPGSHVVLYLGSTKTNGVTYIRYIDATPDNGVDERTKPKSYFDNNHYRPMRRLKIKEV